LQFNLSGLMSQFLILNKIKNFIKIKNQEIDELMEMHTILSEFKYE